SRRNGDRPCLRPTCREARNEAQDPCPPTRPARSFRRRATRPKRSLTLRGPLRYARRRRETEDSMGLLDGKVAIVTGAGRGLGGEEALALARHGAKVIVNAVGTSLAGEGADASPAAEVVRTITAAGGTAVTNGEDVADWAGARRAIEQAYDTYGRLDV